MKLKTQLPKVADTVFLGVDHLKKGTYVIHFTNKEKVIKTLTLNKK